VYDASGRRIENLARGPLAAGRHEIPWAARGVAPGVYFLRLTAGVVDERRRLVVLP